MKSKSTLNMKAVLYMIVKFVTEWWHEVIFPWGTVWNVGSTALL